MTQNQKDLVIAAIEPVIDQIVADAVAAAAQPAPGGFSQADIDAAVAASKAQIAALLGKDVSALEADVASLSPAPAPVPPPAA